MTIESLAIRMYVLSTVQEPDGIRERMVGFDSSLERTRIIWLAGPISNYLSSRRASVPLTRFCCRVYRLGLFAR